MDDLEEDNKGKMEADVLLTGWKRIFLQNFDTSFPFIFDHVENSIVILKNR